MTSHAEDKIDFLGQHSFPELHSGDWSFCDSSDTKVNEVLKSNAGRNCVIGRTRGMGGFGLHSNRFDCNESDLRLVTLVAWHSISSATIARARKSPSWTWIQTRRTSAWGCGRGRSCRRRRRSPCPSSAPWSWWTPCSSWVGLRSSSTSVRSPGLASPARRR